MEERSNRKPVAAPVEWMRRDKCHTPVTQDSHAKITVR